MVGGGTYTFESFIYQMSPLFVCFMVAFYMVFGKVYYQLNIGNNN